MQFADLRIVLPIVAIAAVVTAIYFGPGRSHSSMLSSAAPADVAGHAAGDSRLAMQVEALQREVAALKSRATDQQTQPGAHPSEAPLPSPTQSPMEAETIDAQRAVEAERHRTYMASVAQAFADERVDFSWAGNTSSRVAAALEDDEVLRTAAHQLDCRQRTCRLQIEDDGSGTLSQRLTMMSLRLMDVLPIAAAELVEQGNGRNALVLYMSSQPSVAPSGSTK